ncbi:hypothetical protein [Planktothrix sp.]|uniref:hypothetical protein n=1 Tax=Planktothrix sp. TaxID=3088171 RepID=UPI0038D4D150
MLNNFGKFVIVSIIPLIELISTSTSSFAQSTAVPMRLQHGEGIYTMTVPDRDTTRSAYGGKLRLYDVHIAKMFEVTYYDCNNQGSSRTWLYYAGNGQINMGEFFISCDLANRIVNRYGLGQPESTVIEYSQEEAGPPIPRNRSIQILDITGSKVDSWIDFVQGFKPVR